MKKSNWLIFFIIFTVSCLDDPDCYQLHNDVLGVTFRVLGTGQGDSVQLKNFSRPNQDTIITSFSTVLNYFLEEGRFDFEGSTESNSLLFAYTVKNQFISEECGSSFVLSGLRILEHSFDSARVINASPTKTGGTNIEIFRCPETDTLTIDFNQLLANTNGSTVTNPRSGYASHDFVSITNPAMPVFSGRAATVKLPVNLQANQTTFIFTTAESVDTLEVRYDRVTEERYRPCGTQTFVTDLAIGEHTFDSISFAIKNFEPSRSLLDPQESNLRVFDCPPTNLLRVNFLRGTSLGSVAVESITGDHFAGNLLNAPISTNNIILPVNLESDISTFYIQYEDSIDTLSVRYVFSSLTFFDACPNPIITNLTLEQIDSNIRIIPTSTTLQYPAAANVEITVD